MINKKIEENSLNTIITIGDDSTVYKLRVVGDSRPEFYVNQRLLSPDEMEKRLKKEGIKVKNDKVVDFEKLYWDPAVELGL